MKKLFLLAVALTAFCQTIDAAPKIKETYVFDKNIQYKNGDDYTAERCKLDVAYVEEHGEARPVVIWFHGGGLDHGKKGFPKGILSNRAVVVTVEYRLYPQVQVADILDDAAAAVAWTFGNIGKYGGDSTKVFLSGFSAGAYISAMLATDAHYLEKYGLRPGRLAGIAPVSGQMITHYTHRKSLGIKYNQPVIDEFAPVYHVRTKDIPPVLLITGDRTMDMAGRFEENDYMAAMLVLNKHKDVQVCEYQGYGHKSELVYSVIPRIYKWIYKHIDTTENKKK